MKIASSLRPLWSVLLCSLVCNLSYAQSAPPNDNCTRATAVTVGAPPIIGNLTFATGDVSQLPPDGAFGNGCSGVSIGSTSRGVWYTFQGTGDTVWINTCLDRPGGSYISVYTGTCGAFQCVVGDASIICPVTEKVLVPTARGVTYHVLVRANVLAISLQISSITPPSNDACATAQPLMFGTSVIGNVSLAQSDELEFGPANRCIGFNDPGLWYTFVGTGGTVWPTACFPNSINTVISVYQGGCGKGILQCVASTINPCVSRFSFITIIDQTYYMLVQSDSPRARDGQPFELLLSKLPGTVTAADTCGQATPLTLGTTLTGNLSAATPDATGVPNDCLAGNPITGNGVWFSFDGNGKNVTADTCARFSAETHISVYTGSCGNDTLKCLKGTYNPCIIPKFTFETVLGTKYYINVRYPTKNIVGQVFDLVLYMEGNAVTLTPKAPVMAPVGPAPTPVAPVPRAPTPSAPVPTAPIPVAPSVPVPTAPKAPMVVPAPAVPPLAPASAPLAPAPIPTAPMAAPEPCGLLGLRLLCLTGCGLLGRLLKLCQE